MRARLIARATAVALVALGVMSAVLINFATEWKDNLLAWAAVGIVSLLTGILTIRVLSDGANSPASESGIQKQSSGNNSTNYQAGRDLSIGTESQRLENDTTSD